MTSPNLIAIDSRTSTEADLRALALAKVMATKLYESILLAPTKEMSDDELIDREIQLAMARKAMFAANTAFDKAL